MDMNYGEDSNFIKTEEDMNYDYAYELENEQYLSEFDLSEDGTNSVASSTDIPAPHYGALPPANQGYQFADQFTHDSSLYNMHAHPQQTSQQGSRQGSVEPQASNQPAENRPFKNLSFDPKPEEMEYDWMSVILNQTHPPGPMERKVPEIEAKRTQFENFMQKIRFGADNNGLSVFKRSNEDLEAYSRYVNQPLAYTIQLANFPDRSRVETQIKCRVKISEAVSQKPAHHLMLQLPSRTVSRPRYQLANDNSLKQIPGLPNNSLWLSIDGIDPDNPTEQLYMCSKCLTREQKRAYRKRHMDKYEDKYWDQDVSRGIVLINGKQIQFIDEEGYVELPLRVVCYCRHHAVKDGFQLVLTLRDCNNNVVGLCKSPRILISDSNRMNRRENSISSIDSGTESVGSNSSANSTGSADSASSDIVDGSYMPPMPSSMGTKLPTHGMPRMHRAGSNASDASSSAHPYMKPKAMAQRTSRQPGSISSIPSAMKVPASANPSQGLPTSVNPQLTMNRPSAVPRSIPSWVDSISAADPIANPQEEISEGPVPVVLRAIPPTGSIRGGIEVTLLGENFRPNLSVMFGENKAISTQYWSNSTIIAHLPPSTQPGIVPVTFEGVNARANVPTGTFTYINDGDGKLKELALQMIGYKMSGQIEEAGDVAQKIVVRDEVYSESFSNNGNTSGDGPVNSYSVPDNAESLALWVLDNLNNICPDRVANINLRNSEGQTMIHIAAMLGYAKVVESLIAKNAYVDTQDVSGMTPLHFAVMFGSRSITRMLLLADADPFHRTLIGQTALELADDTVKDLLPQDQRSWYGELNKRGSSMSLSSMGSQPQTPAHVLRAPTKPESEFIAEETNASTSSDQNSSDNDMPHSAGTIISSDVLEIGKPSTSPPSYFRLYPDDDTFKLRQRSQTHTLAEKQTITKPTTELVPSTNDESLSQAINSNYWLSHLGPKITELKKDKMLFTFWIPLSLITILGILAIYVVRYDGGRLKPLVTFGYDYAEKLTKKIINRIMPFPHLNGNAAPARFIRPN